MTRFSGTNMYVWLMQADPFNGGSLHALCDPGRSPRAYNAETGAVVSETYAVQAPDKSFTPTAGTANCYWAYPLR